MKNLFDLAGKVAVVTGASSGLGASAAIAYAEYGADVALLARRKEKLEAVAEKIEKIGRRAKVVVCDVADENSVESAVKEVIAEFGKIDILLNNAGRAVRGMVDQLSLDDWNSAIDTNLTGVYLVSKNVIPYMKKNGGGKIVNIASVNALIGDKSSELARHAYNATKAAVMGLTIGMAASYGMDGITVNSIGPGLFETEMTEGTLFKHEGFMTRYNALCPMGRPASKDELNGTIIYFSSNASSYVTGQYVIVDGGISIV